MAIPNSEPENQEPMSLREAKRRSNPELKADLPNLSLRDGEGFLERRNSEPASGAAAFEESGGVGEFCASLNVPASYKAVDICAVKDVARAVCVQDIAGARVSGDLERAAILGCAYASFFVS